MELGIRVRRIWRKTDEETCGEEEDELRDKGYLERTLRSMRFINADFISLLALTHDCYMAAHSLLGVGRLSIFGAMMKRYNFESTLVHLYELNDPQVFLETGVEASQSHARIITSEPLARTISPVCRISLFPRLPFVLQVGQLLENSTLYCCN